MNNRTNGRRYRYEHIILKWTSQSEYLFARSYASEIVLERFPLFGVKGRITTIGYVLKRKLIYLRAV